jgi:hypothetical protein
MHQKVEVRERILKRYKFTRRNRLIFVNVLLPQNLDGTGLHLCALYVYEHGPDNEASNNMHP